MVKEVVIAAYRSDRFWCSIAMQLKRQDKSAHLMSYFDQFDHHVIIMINPTFHLA